MRAHILSIGSELILGHLTDTNATYLAQELVGLGIELLHVTHVGDDRARIARAIRAALEDAQLVICTGGLGPTEDDLTREAIADVVGETPSVDPSLLRTIEVFFAARGLVMPERNQKQAWLIPSAEALPNPIGTAPGWLVRSRDAVIIAMPGVPREMTRMWREQVTPRIEERLPSRVVRTVTLRTIGIGESAAEQCLADLVAVANPTVATYAKDDGVHIRVTGVGSTVAEAEELRDRAAAEVRRRLDRFIYGTDGTSLASALVALLRTNALVVGIVDRGGGGCFASLLLAEPDAASVVAGALVGPSVECAATALADEALTMPRASLGLGIAVAPRPVESVHEATIHVVLAGALSADERFPIRSGFEEIQRRSALMAADVLRRALSHRR